eukprot:9637703-Ditylum_brightwellii.AAC.1
MFILNACRFQYQTLKEELHNSLTQGWNGYPNTIEQGYTMLCKCCGHGTPRINSEPQLAFLTNAGPGGGYKEVVPLLGGGKPKTHTTCNKCGKLGHYANRCPTLKVEKAISAFGIESDEDKGYESGNSNEFIYPTSKHKRVSRDWLLLDNQSTTNIMCNRKYVKNIRRVNKTLTMNCFEHCTKTNYICDVPGYGTSWFYEKGTVNIVSLSKVKYCYQVTYDYEGEGKFIMHKPNYHVEFIKSPNALYYHNMSDMLMSFAITTIKGNRKMPTRRE